MDWQGEFPPGRQGRDGVMEMVASAPAEVGPAEIGQWAARVERIGFDVLHVPETIHDPFTVSALALQATNHITVRTSMALAFPRSPMITAYAAWDLARYGGGRFQLGIASQVRGNIVGRFSTPWTEPVAQLGDYIQSLRAIFDSFQTGAALDHHGSHYTFTKLQPYFNPGPVNHPAPQIWTGGVNYRMCVMAGRLADGFVCHPTSSHPVTLTANTLPALRDGAKTAQRTAPLAVVVNPRPIVASTQEGVDALLPSHRAELAFLYSTPAYRRQLEHFGLSDIAAALSTLASRGQWNEMSQLLTDEVMSRLLAQGTYDDIPDILREWYSGLCTGLILPVPADDTDDPHLARVVERCRRIPTLPGLTGSGSQLETL